MPSPLTPVEIAQHLGRPTQRAWLALQPLHGTPAGFLSLFETRTLSGHRLEIDLLGVAPSARGKGLASALMERAMDYWRQTDATMARSLIRQGNLAAERVFQRAGFRPRYPPVELLIRSPGKTKDDSPGSSMQIDAYIDSDFQARAAFSPAFRWWCTERESLVLVARHKQRVVGLTEFLEVHTLSYGGIWLETLWAADDDFDVLLALANATCHWAASRSLQLAGATIDLSRDRVRAVLRRSGWTAQGCYSVYQCRKSPSDTDRSRD